MATPMTIADKYAAIISLLKDARGDWIEDINGADFVQEVSILIADPTAPDPVWWVVTLREHGDDEDSCHIIQADDEAAAVTLARTRFAEDNNHEERSGNCRSCGTAPCEKSCGACDYPDPPEMFVNHVIRCTGPEPEHVRSAPC